MSLKNLYTYVYSIYCTPLYYKILTMPIASSMFLSGVSVFFIWWVKATEDVVVILGCLFNAISIAGWNALNVLNAQSYPTELRSVKI